MFAVRAQTNHVSHPRSVDLTIEGAVDLIFFEIQHFKNVQATPDGQTWQYIE